MKDEKLLYKGRTVAVAEYSTSHLECYKQLHMPEFGARLHVMSSMSSDLYCRKASNTPFRTTVTVFPSFAQLDDFAAICVILLFYHANYI